jgi:hypothetical protein
VIDRVVRVHQAVGADYTTNTLRYTYPDGLDVEVLSFAALARAHAEAQRPSEREHVTPYLRNPARFRIVNVEHEVDLSARRFHWCVDTADDLAFVRAVYERLGEQPSFGMEAVLDLLDREPRLLEIQAPKIPNAGYFRSLYQEADPSANLRPLPGRFVRADGAFVVDEHGVTYLDYDQSLAPAAIDFARAEELKWLGQRLIDGLNALASEAGLGARIAAGGHPLAAVLRFADAAGHDDPLLARAFAREAAKRGVIVRRRHFLTAWHDQRAIDLTLVAYAGALKWLAGWLAANDRRQAARARRAQ